MKQYSTEEIQQILAQQAAQTADFRKKEKIKPGYIENYIHLKNLSEANVGKKRPSEVITKMHASRDHQTIGKKISGAKQTLTDEQALEVYELCKPYWKKEGAREFHKQLAKKYGVSRDKIRITAIGDHPALQNVDTSWQYRKHGRVILTTPAGERHEFEHVLDAVKFMDTFDHGVKDIKRFAVEKIRLLEPNTPTRMRRRFWKGWIFERQPNDQ